MTIELEVGEQGQDIRGGFAGTGLGARYHIASLEYDWDGFFLNRRTLVKMHIP